MTIKNIKQLRINSNKTQEEIAKILNMPQSSYQHYENGRSEPNIEKLIKLADYYNVSLDYLVGRHFKDDLGFIEPEDYAYIKHFLELPENIKNKIIGMSYTIEQMEK